MLYTTKLRGFVVSAKTMTHLQMEWLKSRDHSPGPLNEGDGYINLDGKPTSAYFNRLGEVWMKTKVGATKLYPLPAEMAVTS